MSTLETSIRTACARVAPAWPLDRQIAVNPLWGWVEQPLDGAAASVAALSGAWVLPSRAWFLSQWNGGRLTYEHLLAVAGRACDRRPSPADVDARALAQRLLDALHRPEVDAQPLPLLSRQASDTREPARTPSWDEVATHQISQHCAAYFDRHQSLWRLAGADGLWCSWRRHVGSDAALPWRRGRAEVLAEMAGWPEDPQAAIGALLDVLSVPEAGRTPYLTALLLSVQGWAAWCAWLRWEAALEQREDHHLVELLAVRLAWEVLLDADHGRGLSCAAWRGAWERAAERVDALADACRLDILLLEASELAFQAPLARALCARSDATQAPPPAVRAVFCIDVRSERLRRALETVAPDVQTSGFAGFFGMPIAYAPLGTDACRPQLPGLLPPRWSVGERPAGEASLAQRWSRRRRAALSQAAAWDAWRQSPASAFGFVEAWGAAALAKLARASFPSTRATAGPEREGLQARAALHPRFDLMEQEPQRAAELAHSVLRAMGLVQDFPALVLLVGHGSRTTNNPHAAGLACGACGGQSGELNARVLAALLNDREVRGRLAALGIAIPEATHFLAALHDTVTDDVDCFDVAEIPSSLEPPTRRLLAALRQAGERVRAERADSLGLQRLVDRPAALARALRRRANDWSELRPEWGLAGNAAFIAAPRTRTRGLDLEGRAFLHDYDWRHDPDGSVLELVMTAPMVVAHWINFQYLASTTAPQRFGSGSKVLHNVVGGRIGVFEGNGGDLRIGLPWQSVHDGTRLRHEPLRLAVFIEAPRAMIDAVLRQHAKVRLLVDNGWLHLLRLDAASAFVERYDRGRWRPLEGEPSWADPLAAPGVAQGAGHEPRVSRL